MRVLFVAEAVTLAHVARPAVLARALAASGHEVHFASAPRFETCLRGVNTIRHTIHSISAESFLSALAHGRPVYDEATLSAYFEDDRKLIREIRPDVVVGDFRLTLPSAATLAGVPSINITNAHWSPYRTEVHYPIPEHPATRWLPIGVAQAAFNLIRPAVFRIHASPLNRLRRRLGLPVFSDLREAYTHADLTLYADVPELIPLSHDTPATHRFIGPLLWAPDLPEPPWLESLDVSRPLIYLSLGSSGQLGVLPGVVAALGDMPVNVAMATAGRLDTRDVPSNFFTADILPGDKLAERANLVICNGGSATAYQALAVGCPVLGIPALMDQHLTMQAVESVGAGLCVRSDCVTAERVKAAVSALVSTKAFRERAVSVAGWFAGRRAPTEFGAILQTMGERR
jgi:UDP:flavonoid glycosyltransferase YjiC (YdhE family)